MILMKKSKTKVCHPFHQWHKFCATLFLMPLALLFVSCNPHKVDVQLEESAPVQKVTTYSDALSDLGLMTEIYATGLVKIQSEDIADNTGTAGATGGEIQRNITEIMKSTLNSIGGNITFIEYNPSYIQNQMVTGYSNFDQKIIPDVVITGGITEFDRGLETRGKGTDASAEYEFANAGSSLPSNKVGFEYGDSSKGGKARITLDFNMKDFTTLAGISKMNTVNSMDVHKAVREQEIGITLFGPTFGMKGSIKKVQGRHEAVRLLVQVSMIQMVGKYLVLPYWRLLGDDNVSDKIVMDKLARSFYQMPETDRIVNVQEWLFISGYDVDITGMIDEKTAAALSRYNPGFSGNALDMDTFIAVYTNIPLDHAALGRRNMITKMYESMQAEPAYAAPAQPEPVPQPVASAPTAAAAQPAQQAQAQTPTPEPTAAPARQAPQPRKSSSSAIGRMLTDDEW